MTRRRLSVHTRLAVFRRDGYQCRHCGATGGAELFETDHIEPVSWAGSDDEWNFQTLCRPCNRRKAARFRG